MTRRRVLCDLCGASAEWGEAHALLCTACGAGLSRKGHKQEHVSQRILAQVFPGLCPPIPQPTHSRTATHPHSVTLE